MHSPAEHGWMTVAWMVTKVWPLVPGSLGPRRMVPRSDERPITGMMTTSHLPERAQWLRSAWTSFMGGIVGERRLG